MSTYRVTWAWAGASGEVLDPDGVTWAEASSMFDSRLSSGRTVTLAMRLSGVDVVDLITRHGHIPETGRATLYADDVELIAGPWRDVEWGQADDAITITLSDETADDRGTIAGEVQVGRIVYEQSALDSYMRFFRGYGSNVLKIATDLWTAAQHTAVGRWYPWVIGAPGDDDHPGSPGYLIDVGGTYDAGVLIHGGEPGGVTAATVWGPTVADTSSWDSEAATVSEAQDVAGNVVTRCDFGTAGSQVQRNDDGEYYVSWTSGGPTPGGAGDVCMMLLDASTARWDVGAWQAVRHRLNAYVLAGYTEEPVPPLDLLRDAIWPLLPIAVVQGPRGLRPALWPWLDDDGRGTLVVAGAGFARGSMVGRLPLRAEPEVTVEYAWDPKESVYTRAVTYSAADSLVSAHLVTADGKGRSTPVSARFVWDDHTAAQIARDRVQVAGRAPWTVSYMADPSVYGAEGTAPLEIGQAVRLTDDGIGMSAAPGVVGEIERSGADLRVTLYLRADPLRG